MAKYGLEAMQKKTLDGPASGEGGMAVDWCANLILVFLLNTLYLEIVKWEGRDLLRGFEVVETK